MINIYDYYITPDEYAEAERNGINARCLNSRIRSQAWPKRKAITTPKGLKTDRSHLKSMLINHGISHIQFNNRLRWGWDELRAATTPIQDKEGLRRQFFQMIEQIRKYPREIVDLASNNGIKYETFRHRVKAGWSIELASTLPPSPSNASMILKQKYGEDYCKNYIKNIKNWIFVKTKR